MSWLSTRIAVRYIFSRKSHSAINLISVVAVCGVVVASVALVCVLSVFNGFHSLIEGKLSVIDPAVKVVPATGKAISSPDSLIDVITAVPGVAYAIPGITEQALARCGDKQLPVMVKGVVENYDSLSAISSVVKEDGELVCYHFYDMGMVRRHLLENTKFDTPASSKMAKDKDGKPKGFQRKPYCVLYRNEEGELEIKLNFQIRWK